MIFFKDDDSKKKVNNLLGQLGYEYNFVFVLAPTVRAFYPIIENLFINGDMSIEISKESIVYLIVSSLAQLLGKPKNIIDELYEKIKELKVENFLPKVKKVFEIFKKVVNFFSKRIKIMIENYIELFAYTSLFVPFALTFSQVIESQGLGLEQFIEAFSKDFKGKLLSTTFGVSVFTLKHFIEDLLESLKKLKKKPIEVKNIIKRNLDLKESNIISFKDYDLLVS